MWSSFKRPQAQYNLQIKMRIEVFEKLIKHFSRLEQKIQDFLEERRKAFPRFYFLTDSQFLDFLTLANSNQDFNKYISVLFQGASKLFINRILGRETMRDTA
jgi:dynein heavy chain